MRVTRRDLDLLAEAYDDISGPKGMENTEDAEETQELHPLLQEIKDEIDTGIRWEYFIDKATRALGERYQPSRGRDLNYFLDKVGNLIQWQLEYQDEDDGADGAYIMGVEDLSPEPSDDEDAESMVPRKKLRFQSQQPEQQKPVVGNVKPPIRKLSFLSQQEK
jgi:hypothetical protein